MLPSAIFFALRAAYTARNKQELFYFYHIANQCHTGNQHAGTAFEIGWAGGEVIAIVGANIYHRVGTQALGFFAQRFHG